MTRTSSEEILIDEIRVLTQGILATIHGKSPVPQTVRQAQLLEAQFRAARSEHMRRTVLEKLTMVKQELERLRATGG